MEVTIEHLGAVRFEIKARQPTLACDQPVENGSFDEGMTPPELLLASLASCAGFYAAQYLRKFKLATEGTWVRVLADQAKDRARLDNFRMEIEPSLELRAQHPEGVERAVHTASSTTRCSALPKFQSRAKSQPRPQDKTAPTQPSG